MLRLIRIGSMRTEVAVLSLLPVPVPPSHDEGRHDAKRNIAALALSLLALVALGGTIAARAAASGPLAPDTTITFGPTGWTNLTNPVFAYESSDPNARFECRLDSAPFEPCGPAEEEARGDGPQHKLTQGRHTFEVRAVNAEGIPDPTPAAARFVVDTHFPTVRILSGPPRITHFRWPRFRLKVADEESFWCIIGGRTTTGKRVLIKRRSCDGRQSFRSPRRLADGHYSFHVVAFTRAGNESIESWAFSVAG
jgi:hypothetical protein